MTVYRKRMVEEIVLRGYDKNTQDSYVRSMVRLCGFAGKTPDRSQRPPHRWWLEECL